MSSPDPAQLESVSLFNAFETVLECLKQMEAMLMGMRQMRLYVSAGPGKQMLESLIEEAETQIADIKRRVIQ